MKIVKKPSRHIHNTLLCTNNSTSQIENLGTMFGEDWPLQGLVQIVTDQFIPTTPLNLQLLRHYLIFHEKLLHLYVLCSLVATCSTICLQQNGTFVILVDNSDPSRIPLICQEIIRPQDMTRYIIHTHKFCLH